MSSAAKAKLICKILAKRFLIEGGYALAGGPIGAQQNGMQLASTLKAPALWEESEEFVGISVQAVGYTQGADEPIVIIYATKGSARSFSKVPSEIDGVPVEVKRIGVVNIRPELATSATGQPNVFVRKNRIACGSSCAPAAEQYAGTLGALVRRSGSLFALSNNHVFAACNHTPVNMPIMSPANCDAKPHIRAPSEVARHTEIMPFRSGDPDLVPPCLEDVAIAAVPNPQAVSSWQGGDDGYDTPTTVVAPSSGMAVKKVGRTTGQTHGFVEALISEPTPVPCNGRHFRGTVWFRDMWYLVGSGPGFALPGDSGSLVVTEDGKNAVGLLFSANKTGDYGLMIPIQHVLSHFGGLTLVDKHGV